MALFERLTESRIREAIDAGSFDGLSGSGKPLVRDDLARVPAELRAGYRILKNAEVAPPEVALRSEIYRLDQLIARSSDERERAELRRRRLRTDLEYSIRLERAKRSAAPRRA